MKSASDVSALFPRLMNLENPTLLPMAQSRIAVQSAPDWEKKPISPTGGMPGGEGGVQAALGVDDPQAVRADDADAQLTDAEAEGLLQLGPLAAAPP